MKRSYTQNLLKTFLLICLSFVIKSNKASEIILFYNNAVVWLPQQNIKGKLAGFFADRVIVYSNDSSFFAQVKKDSSFSFPLIVSEEGNNIKVIAEDNGQTVSSKEIHLRLGYHPLPVVKPYAKVQKHNLSLHTKIIYNPSNKPIQFYWRADMKNPSPVRITHSKDSVATVSIPSADGVYYFDLLVISGKDSATFKTFITKKGDQTTAFDLQNEYADWINDAIIYEITPSYFVKHGTYKDIIQKLPELKQLGINTIWLQPVYKNADGGQGYGITDYFSLRPELGDEAQLKQLIKEAKSRNIRIMFDFVPNHTSIYHPYSKDVIQNGTSSHYYDFYQHEDDGAAYSSYYHKDKNDFIFYFWKHLINLNYDNPEVLRWITEACKYWLREFDIDGFRFDAVWGVNARCEQFAQQLRTELKSIKPDFLMLAEDKGADENVYKLGFDLAYDWEKDTSWVSHWSWQYEYDPKKSFTIFNFPDSKKRADMLRRQLFKNDSSRHRLFRFLENNDLPRFIADHGVDRTKMAAALLFSLPGVPMIYCGQEVGFVSPLYSGRLIFSADSSIQSSDHYGLFDYYAKLTKLRSAFLALRSRQMEEILVLPSSTLLAFTRESEQQKFIILLNLDSSDANAEIGIQKYASLLSKKAGWQLKDVLTSEAFTVQQKVVIPMKGYSTRWLLLQKKNL